MPIYEYVCSKCDSKFELLRPLSCAEQSAACPKCNAEARRVFSPFAARSGSLENGVGYESIAGSGSSCSGCSSGSCNTCH